MEPDYKALAPFFTLSKAKPKPKPSKRYLALQERSKVFGGHIDKRNGKYFVWSGLHNGGSAEAECQNLNEVEWTVEGWEKQYKATGSAG
jgi:hypothetical protein